jgi:hypothetical protein
MSRMVCAAVVAIVVVALVLVMRTLRATEKRLVRLEARLEQLSQRLPSLPRAVEAVSSRMPAAIVDGDAIAAPVANRLRATELAPSASPVATVPMALPEVASAIHARDQLAAKDVRSLRAELAAATRDDGHEAARQIALAIISLPLS